MLTATLILSIACLILLLISFVAKPKSSLTTFEIIKTIEKENDKLRRELQLSNQGEQQLFKQLNDMLITTVRSYNESVMSTLSTSANNQAELLKQLEDRMRDLRQTNANQTEMVDKKLELMLFENAKKLDEMRATVDEKLNTNLTNRLNESFNVISERLEALYKGFGEIQNLSNGVSDLNKILGNVKVRGTFGEVQLNSLLEQMLAPTQYLTNVQINPSLSERVEFAIKLPGKDDRDILLPIDAKFPLEDYARLIEASDKNNQAEVTASLKALERRIKDEAKKIKQKYIFPPVSTDFAIMYIPIEGLYAEIIRNSELVDFIQREHHIMICSPTTLAALLSSIQMGFKTLYIEKRSSEIWELLTSFKREFGNFMELLAKTQKKILEANETLDSATKKSQKIQKQLNTVTSGASEYLLDEPDEEK